MIPKLSSLANDGTQIKKKLLIKKITIFTFIHLSTVVNSVIKERLKHAKNYSPLVDKEGGTHKCVVVDKGVGSMKVAKQFLKCVYYKSGHSR